MTQPSPVPIGSMPVFCSKFCCSRRVDPFSPFPGSGLCGLDSPSSIAVDLQEMYIVLLYHMLYLVMSFASTNPQMSTEPFLAT